jgi:23S rRNA pseudouridine2605 synthase
MERLQKIIARAGVSSRRAAEELISAGRVRVNGKVVTELGTSADPRVDRVEVDGKRLVREDFVYVVLHKPKNVVSTLSDPEGRPTVSEYLRGFDARLYPVGRLDFATSGVLLATNDGDFANGMLHPKGGVPKTYVVKVRGVMDAPDLKRWEEGVDLEDGRTLPARVSVIRREPDRTWFEITLREGRNQQIRRMGEATGFLVMRLARVSFAGVTHEGLRPGQSRQLTWQELSALKETFGVPKRVPKGERDLEVRGRPTRSGRSTGSPAPSAESGAKPRAASKARAETRGPRGETRGALKARAETRGPRGSNARGETRGPRGKTRSPSREPADDETAAACPVRGERRPASRRK